MIAGSLKRLTEQEEDKENFDLPDDISFKQVQRILKDLDLTLKNPQ